MSFVVEATHCSSRPFGWCSDSLPQFVLVVGLLLTLIAIVVAVAIVLEVTPRFEGRATVRDAVQEDSPEASVEAVSLVRRGECAELSSARRIVVIDLASAMIRSKLDRAAQAQLPLVREGRCFRPPVSATTSPGQATLRLSSLRPRMLETRTL